MFQRLDRMRKHAFGNMILFGETNNSSISGVWIWRGQGLAFEVGSLESLSKNCYVKKPFINNCILAYLFSCLKICRQTMKPTHGESWSGELMSARSSLQSTGLGKENSEERKSTKEKHSNRHFLYPKLLSVLKCVKPNIESSASQDQKMKKINGISPNVLGLFFTSITASK